MSAYELAHLNIATMREPLEAPGMAEFVANLDRINALADAAPGFIWRLQDEAGNATAIRPIGASALVNVSVWQDIPSLQRYAFETAHVEIWRRRREWFERMEEASVVLWWVPNGHRPSESEAADRLAHLRAHGATAQAFTFKQ